jgi:hypothetical protein
MISSSVWLWSTTPNGPNMTEYNGNIVLPKTILGIFSYCTIATNDQINNIILEFAYSRLWASERNVADNSVGNPYKYRLKKRNFEADLGYAVGSSEQELALLWECPERFHNPRTS